MYEEKVIAGVLNYRANAGDEWHPMDAATLTAKLLESRRHERGAPLTLAEQQQRAFSLPWLNRYGGAAACSPPQGQSRFDVR